ncbi:MAG: pilus assembly protein [Actinobacteria bacterium]|nr:pilus assembly protein [Actinomycetota bacterium]
MNTKQHTEWGSATVEAVVGVPVFILLILLAIMGGRVTLAKQAVDAAAADAARVASLSRDATKASSNAIKVAEASLANQGINCLDTSVTIDTAALRRPAGTPGSVTATLTCVIDLTDLGLAAASRTITSSVTSPVDTYVERSAP